MSALLCLGEPLAEFNHRPDGSVDLGFGGDVSNCAIAAGRLGAKVAVHCSLGRDDAGRGLMDLWNAEHVQVDHVLFHLTAPTGAYHIKHNEDGHEFSYDRAGSAASLMRDADLNLDAIAQARILHVSGISQAISEEAASCVMAAIDHANQSSTLVSYDTNLRLQLWPLDQAQTTIHTAVAKADIVLPGLDDARQLTGLDTADAIADYYLDLGPKIVALTMGGEGVMIATPSQRETIKPHSVNAVDATGAGDTFDGAFLSEILLGKDPFEAARFANAAAALSTQSYGALAGMPNRDAVMQLLRS